MGLIGFTKTLSIELGEYGISANAILPGAVEGARIQKVFEGRRAQLSGRSVEEVMKDSMAYQSIKRLVDPHDIAALAVFLASDSGKSIGSDAADRQRYTGGFISRLTKNENLLRPNLFGY